MRKLIGLAILTGSLCSPVWADDILIGQVADMTGPEGAWSTDFTNGAKAAFDQINAQGGINGRKLRLVTIDTKGQPGKGVTATEQLIEKDKVQVLFGFTGSAQIEQIARRKVLQKNGVSLFAPLSGSDMIRGVANGSGDSRDVYVPEMFHIRASYSQEARKLVKQAINLGMTRIAVFYANDSFGTRGLEAIEAEVGRKKLSLAAKGNYDPNKNEVAEAVNQISQAQPQTVIMVADEANTARFVKAMRARMPGLQLLGLSLISPQQLIRDAGLEAAQGVGLSQVVPSPFNSTTPVARAYRDAVARNGSKEITYAGLEGYLGARSLIEVLQKAGAQWTPDKLSKVAESIGSMDLGGYTIEYSNGDHRGSSTVDIAVISKDGKVLN